MRRGAVPARRGPLAGAAQARRSVAGSIVRITAYVAGMCLCAAGLPRLRLGCKTDPGAGSPRGGTGDGMTYIITATNLVGAISLRRDAPGAAVKKALELTAQGMMDVRITDEAGRQYEPAEFDQLQVAEK